MKKNVEIPIETALFASRHLYHLSEFIGDLRLKELVKNASKEISSAVAMQCSGDEITNAIMNIISKENET